METRYTEIFRSEARDHLVAIDGLLLRLERDPGRRELLDELFRSVHTLKGASAAMGLHAAERIAHAMEEALTRLQRGEAGPDAALIELMLEGADALSRAVEELEPAGVGDLLQRLGGGQEGDGGAGDHAPAAAIDGVSAGVDPGDGKPAASAAPLADTRPAAADLRVRVRMTAECAMPAVRAAMVLKVVRGVAEVVRCEPAEEEILAGRLAGEVVLWVRGGVDGEALERLVRGVGEVEAVEIGAEAADRAEPARGAGAIARVAQVRLDRLVDQMGELLIARDRLSRRAHPAAAADSALRDALDAVTRLIDELREEILRLRMVPVGEAFDRFPRLVRDAARSLGRAVELEIAGQQEEVDRGLLNEVADLLVHLLRNAVDHGIEPPDEREAAGKPRVGRIRLSAARDGATVRIEVADDGRGVDRERVLHTARDRGLLAGADPTDDEAILSLLTTPGFSTSARVTGVSGRGVGLDAVRARARALGGGLEIRSEAGRGSSFALRLPLSLTLIQALRFEAGGAYYSVPLAAVDEVAAIEAFGADGARIGDSLLPTLDLRALLAGGEGASADSDPAVIVVSFGEARGALVVGGLVGQHQAVVKPVDLPASAVRIFSGATVLPDGRPSLVLDPAAAVAMAAGASG